MISIEFDFLNKLCQKKSQLFTKSYAENDPKMEFSNFQGWQRFLTMLNPMNTFSENFEILLVFLPILFYDLNSSLEIFSSNFFHQNFIRRNFF